MQSYSLETFFKCSCVKEIKLFEMKLVPQFVSALFLFRRIILQLYFAMALEMPQFPSLHSFHLKIFATIV